MSKSGYWGDHVILHSASQIYQREFMILESHGEYDYTHIPYPGPTAYLGHIGEYHYVLIVPESEVPDLAPLLSTLQISRTKNEPVRCIDYIVDNFESTLKNKRMDRLFILAQSYILDWDYYKRLKLNEDYISEYEAEVEKLQKEFCTNLPSAEVPTISLQFMSLINNQLIMDPISVKEKAAVMYWLPLLYYHPQLQLQSPSPTSELSLTGSFLCHLFDSFWLSYCKDAFDIQLMWSRNTNIIFACDALYGESLLCDGYLYTYIDGKPYIVAIFEDKANSTARDKDRGKIAEISRFAIDSLREFNLPCDMLEKIIIPGVQTANTHVDYFLTSWKFKPEHFYIFNKVAEYDMSTKDELIQAAQRLWNIVDIIQNTIEILKSASKNKKPHVYPTRPYVERSPCTEPTTIYKSGSVKQPSPFGMK